MTTEWKIQHKMTLQCRDTQAYSWSLRNCVTLVKWLNFGLQFSQPNKCVSFGGFQTFTFAINKKVKFSAMLELFWLNQWVGVQSPRAPKHFSLPFLRLHADPWGALGIQRVSIKTTDRQDLYTWMLSIHLELAHSSLFLSSDYALSKLCYLFSMLCLPTIY